MGDQLDANGDPEVAGFLSDMARAVRQGKVRLPPPEGRPSGAEDIMDALEALRDPSKRRPDIDARLLKAATEAEATGYEPWQEEERESAHRLIRYPRRFVLIAAAACVPLLVGVGLWFWSTPSSVNALEASLDLRIGYGEFGATERGETVLRPGVSAKIRFTLLKPGHYSILLLDRDLRLSCELADREGVAGRHELEWTPADAEEGEATETVIVVAGLFSWEDAEAFSRELNPSLRGLRAERVRQIVDAIHDRFQLAVSTETYVVRPVARE